MISKFKSWGTAEAGTSAVEFAMVAPFLCLTFLATMDLGVILYDRFALNSAVSAAANYTILNASSVNSTNGASLAQILGTVIANDHSANWANATITVNNGPTVTLTAGILTASGTYSAANGCYCPTPVGNGVSWGGVTACGAACASGGLAGKFVSISASTVYNSLFSSTGILPSSIFTTNSVVEVE